MDIIQLHKEFDKDRLELILKQDRQALELAKERLKELEEENKRQMAIILASLSKEDLATFLNGDFSNDFSPKRPKLRVIK